MSLDLSNPTMLASLAQEADREIARRDPLEFINEFCVTYDPRRTPSIVPFKLFPKQAEYILWLHARYTKREDGLVEKSRDMGVTWLCIAYSVWLWLYTPGVKIAFGSRKEDLVDKLGDPDSIFEKIRLLLRNLPAHLLPFGFSIDKHAGFMKIINPANGATITGEAGDNIGRGGRNSIYFKDESAFYERPERIEAALSQNSDCKIDVSTPNGTGNPFYRKRHGGAFKVFTFHWRDDPRKGEDWYERQKRLLDPVIVAQEIDIDYTASVEDILIPGAWVQAAIDFRGARRSGRGVAGLDIGGGRDRSVFMARFGDVVECIESWSEGDTTNTAYRARELQKRCGAAVLNFDAIGVGAGVASTLGHANAEAVGINVGLPPTDAMWDDGLTSREKFTNLKAEAWWKMRERFRVTYEVVNGLYQDDAEGEAEVISIPNHSELVRQLSQPKWLRVASGKIAVESKEQLRRRGVKSPDFADALALTFVENTTAVERWALY